MSCESSVKVPVCGLELALDTSNIEAGISEERVLKIVNQYIQSIGTMPIGDGISYLLDEQWTGKYWIDGKKIYQKTIQNTWQITNLSNGL